MVLRSGRRGPRKVSGRQRGAPAAGHRDGPRRSGLVHRGRGRQRPRDQPARCEAVRGAQVRQGQEDRQGRRVQSRVRTAVGPCRPRPDTPVHRPGPRPDPNGTGPPRRHVEVPAADERNPQPAARVLAARQHRVQPTAIAGKPEVRAVISAWPDPALAQTVTKARLRKVLKAAGRTRYIERDVDLWLDALRTPALHSLLMLEHACGGHLRALLATLDMTAAL